MKRFFREWECLIVWGLVVVGFLAAMVIWNQRRADAYTLSGYPKFQAFDSNGAPLAGGKLYTYEPGSTTDKTTYSTGTGTANTNPVILDSRGEATIYFNGSYKLVLKDSGDSLIWTFDNFAGTGVQYDSSSAVSGYFAISSESGTSEVRFVPGVSGESIFQGTLPVNRLAGSIESGVSTDQLTTGGVFSVNLTSSETLSGTTLYGGMIANLDSESEVTGTVSGVTRGMSFSLELAGNTPYVIQFNAADSLIGIPDFASGASVLHLIGSPGSAYAYVRYLAPNKWIISGASITTRNK